MPPRVALFVMPQEGHFRLMVPLIDGLVAAGIEPVVFTTTLFGEEIQRRGGRFADLFAGRPLDEADDRSAPYPCRFVTFAGRHAEQVAREVREAGASLVIYDSFAVIGRVCAELCGLPCVAVCANHDLGPESVDAVLASVPEVEVSPECERQVEVLRSRHGLEEASPWWWLTSLSPHLNVCCEPPEFLPPASHPKFAPVAFHGSLPAPGEIDARVRAGEAQFDGAAGLRVYASFGTVCVRYWPERVRSAIHAVATAVGDRPGASAVISLSRLPVSEAERRELSAPGVRLVDYADQWSVLAGADLFVTHQGVNSTHDAVWSRVPMASVPFLSDQPILAARCQELGLAVPVAGAGAPLGAEQVHTAIEAIERDRGSFDAALSRARQWERDVIAARPAVIERIAELAGA